MIKVKTQTGPFLNIKHMVQKLQTETFLSLYKCISSAEFSDFFLLFFGFCFVLILGHKIIIFTNLMQML